MKLFNSNASFTRAEIRKNQVSTPLGNISLCINSEAFDINKESITESFYLPNGGYVLCWYTNFVDVELIITPFNPILPEGMKVDECYAAVWRVRGKVNEINCRFSAEWEEGYTWTKGGPESGEHLESQVWENPKFKVSLGTQDGEVVIARSEKNDFLPVTYNKSIDLYSIVEYFNKGLTVPVSNIRINEICQIHFVIAWSKNIEYDTSTWYAVDALPLNLLSERGIW